MAVWSEIMAKARKSARALRCRHCRKAAKVDRGPDDDGYFYVGCYNDMDQCPQIAAWAKTREEAVGIWNDRNRG